MIDINVVKENVNTLSKRLDSLNIDSIFIEQDGKLERIFYSKEHLHELRSYAKLLVSMAIGIHTILDSNIGIRFVFFFCSLIMTTFL